MRVAYLCTDLEILAFREEGASVHIREFTNALIEEGHDVCIVGPWPADPASSLPNARVHEIRPTGVDEFVWNAIAHEPALVDQHLVRDVQFLLYNASFSRLAERVLRQEQPDILLQRESLFGWAGADLARRLNLPLMLEVNAPSCAEQQGYEEFRLERLAARIEGQVLRSADAIIAVSDWIKRWLVSEGIDESAVHVIPNGIDQRVFAVRPSGASIRSRQGLENASIIGYVGTFQPWHDVDGLVTAFAQLRAHRPALHLLLVGDGSQRTALERRIKQLGLTSSVTFTGRIPHTVMPQYLGAMDVAVVPYAAHCAERFYFSPLKLFESMAAGVTTVAPAFGQIGEVITHDQTGYLYDPAQPGGLTTALATLLDDPSRARDIGRRGRELMLRDYTWTTVAHRAAAVASTVLENRRAGARNAPAAQ
jgi:glycosyltransferase involved in cell wall biosynthesis